MISASGKRRGFSRRILHRDPAWPIRPALFGNRVDRPIDRIEPDFGNVSSEQLKGVVTRPSVWIPVLPSMGDQGR